MPAKTTRIVISAIFAAVALGQTPAEQNVDRVFHFTHASTAQELQEIATVIRSMADIRQASVDAGQKSLALQGTAAQIALGEWLLNEFDRPANAHTPATHEYRLTGEGDVVRVFYLSRAETLRDLQEVATVVRSMGDIRRLFTYSAPRAMALRGTTGQMALAEWLIQELDKPRNSQTLAQNSATHEYRPSGRDDDVTRVFYLSRARTLQELQEVATVVRSMGDIRRLFTYSAPRALALRGTTGQMALAEWLIKELDKPENPEALAQDSAAHEYRPSGSDDDVARVFYLAHARTAQRLQEIATQVRTMTGVRRLFIYNAPGALALRGTADQVAMADRLIKERDR